jgi:TolB-like protein/Tfp pilus assembly protein PilF
MEYVKGKTLRELLAGGPLPNDKLIRYATQMAEGLAKAHQAGIVHRDLKPENIIISVDGYVKILDFGLAKLTPLPEEVGSETSTLAQGSTTPGTILGTVGYMSPEQAKGQPADFRSDQFSFGAIVYEMATGHRAFQRDSPVQTLSAIIERVPTPIATLNPKIPAQLRIIVERGLAKKPKQRYESTGGLVRALENISFTPPQEFVAGTGRSESPSVVESIMILPLVDLRPEPGEEYFADGMTEAVITDLAKIGSLRVISRTTAMRYRGTKKSLPDIARELNVDAVLEGSVLRAGQRVRITVRLIKADTDETLWADSYEQALRDVLSLQRELANCIAREIQIKLTPAETAHLARARSVDPEAHDAYLRGRYYWNQRTRTGLNKARGYFEQAIERDPGYASSYVGLADCYVLLGGPLVGELAPQDAMPRAKAAAKKALELDDSQAQAYASLAYARSLYDWDWARSETEFKRALQLGPGHATTHQWYSINLSIQQRHEEAVSEAKLAREFDPLSRIVSAGVGIRWYYAGRYPEAASELQKTLDIEPNFPGAHEYLGRVFLEQGMLEPAIEEFEKATALAERRATFVMNLAHAYALKGQTDDALKLLRELTEATEGYVSSFPVAVVHVGLGGKDQAFEWLEKAYEERSSWLAYLKIDPRLAPLHSDPRFQDLLRRMNFPD